MRRVLMLLGVLLVVLALVFCSAIIGADNPGSKQDIPGIRSIYDPPDPFPPEFTESIPLSGGAFFPFMGQILSPGDTVGYTWYDYQKNCSMGKQIALDGAGGVHFGWMNQVAEGGNRYVDYNYKSSLGAWLGAMHVTLGGAQAGYTNIALLSNNREILSYHHAQAAYPYPYTTYCMLAIEDSTPGSGSFKAFDIPDSLPGAEYLGGWPYIAIDSLDFIHVVMTEADLGAGIAPFAYTRCYVDAESLKCEAPGVAEINITPDEAQPRSNMVAPIDSSGTISVIVVSSPVSNKVAIVFSKYRNPDLFQFDSDVYYIESTNNGQDWIDAGSFSGITKHNITNYSSSDMVRAYSDVAAAYDHNDSLHICWNAHWFDESTGEYSITWSRIYHWSKATGIKRIANGYWDGTNPGAWNRNLGKMSISAKQSNDYLYVTWTQFDPNDISSGGFSNGEIYASASTDGGLSWDIPVNLTNTQSNGCTPGNCESDHWSTLAEGIDDSLHIFYVNDRDAGGISQSEGSWTQSPVLYMNYPAWNPYAHPQIEVDHSLYQDLHTSNNSFKDTSFKVTNFGNAQLYVMVTSSAPWIEVIGDSSFYISAGADPVDVSIRFNASSYSETVLHDSIIVTSNDSVGNGRIVIPVRGCVVTDEDYYHTELAYVANSTMNVLESNLGSLGDQTPNGGMYTFADELYYLEDASVFLATINSNNDTLVSREFMTNHFTHAASNLVVDTLDMGDYAIIRSTSKFYPFFPDIGTIWPGWWWGVEMTIENLIFQGENAPVPENVIISTTQLYPKSVPAWWPSGTPPDLGDLYLGMAIDWDVPTDTGRNNNGGYDDSYILMWQNGAWGMSNYQAGISYLDDSSPYGANIIDNPTYIWPNHGFLDAELYQIASTAGDSVFDENTDLACVMTAEQIVSLSDTVTVKFAMAVTDEGSIDLKNAINKARVYSGALSGAVAGDVNDDWEINIQDWMYLSSYLFAGGSEPVYWGSGDIDGIADVNIGDLVYLNDYLYKMGPPPQTPPFPEVAPDTLITDTLYVTYDSYLGGGKYVFNVELTNSSTVFAMAIPLAFEIGGGSIECDSVSFASTRVSAFARQVGTIDNPGQTVLVGLADAGFMNGLVAGSGVIAKMYFTVSDPSWGYSIDFDTTFVSPSNNLLLAYESPTGLAVPQFVVDVELPIPVANFAGAPVIGEKDLAVSFTDSSEGSVDSRYWSFGDGYISIKQNPVHTYREAGVYDVKLIVTNQFGSDSLIREDYIQVLDKPLADFTADPTVGDLPLAVQFTDNSVGAITDWLWDFGDDSTSTLQNPNHEYSSYGAYDVSLMVTSANGSDTSTKSNYIYSYPALSGDSVKILNVTAVPNQKDVVVPIVQSNTDTLSQIFVPLAFDPEKIQLDSVSFVGTRVENFEILIDSISNEEGHLLLACLVLGPDSYLTAGQGLIANLYLKVKDVVPPDQMIFDTTTVTIGETEYVLQYTEYYLAEPYYPDFAPGSLYVEKMDYTPPETPQNLAALPLESGVSLTWDAVTDPDLRMYAVYKDYNRDSLDDTLATTYNPFYLDLTVSPGETLFYSVSAVDSSWNESEYSDYAHVIFGDTSAPVITLGPTVIALSDTMATIYWETDEEADGYGQIYIDTNWVTADSHLTYLLEHTATVTWLEPSTSYLFRVHSTDSLDNGPTYSDTGLLTTASSPDVTPPQIIFGPAVVYISHNSATIEWTTDEIANGIVFYGETQSFSDSAVDPGFVTSHSISLTDLSPSTEYFYKVSSDDLSGNGPTYSETLSYTTEADPDTLPPIIVEGPIHAGITNNKAVIDWVTDEIATSIVQYGQSQLYGSERIEPDLVQNHQIVLTNLQDSTLYHYRVGSQSPDALIDPTWSSDFWFWTKSAPDTVSPIVLTGPYASWVNNTQAQIDWTTNEISESWVYYGLGGSYDNVAGSPEYVIDHTVVLTNLLPDTTYNYYISSTDPSGNTTESEHSGGGGAQPLDTGDDQFTTRASADVTAPIIISGPHVRHKTHNQALVEWVTDETGNSIVEYGETQEYGTAIDYVEATVNHSAYLTNLNPGTTYHFRVGSKDIAKNGPTYSSDMTFTTSADVPDIDPPVITVTPGIAYMDQTMAIITWETDEPSDSYMGYEQIDGGLAERIVGESYNNLNHMLNMSLASSFNVRVFSTDAYGNGPTYSDYFTVTAPTSPDVQAPLVIYGPELVYISENSAKIRWDTDELSSSFVEYGLSAEYTDFEANPDNDSLHEVTLTNLSASTTYHYRVKSADLFGNIYLGADSTFTTEGSSDLTPPAIPEGLSSSYGDQWTKLTWNENQEGDLGGYNLHRGTVYPGTLPLIASNLADSSYEDQELVNGVTYYYQLTAVDHNSNESPASDVVCSKPLSYKVGDFNGDDEIDVVDVVALINYLFRDAEGHEPLEAGNVNGDDIANVSDVVYLVNYLFRDGVDPSNCTIPEELLARNENRAKAFVGLCLPGDENTNEIEVLLEAEIEEEVAGIELDLNFDISQLEVKEISTTSRTDGLGLYYNVKQDRVKIGMVDIYGIHTVMLGEGSLLNMKFQSKGKGTGVSSIRIENAILVNPSAEELDVEIKPNKLIRTIPQRFSLSQNYPNPFNARTVIRYSLPQDSKVEITIYNILGRKVKTLVNEHQQAGYKTVIWYGTNQKDRMVASGVYFYKIKAGDFVQSKKMLLLK